MSSLVSVGTPRGEDSAFLRRLEEDRRAANEAIQRIVEVSRVEHAFFGNIHVDARCEVSPHDYLSKVAKLNTTAYATQKEGFATGTKEYFQKSAQETVQFLKDHKYAIGAGIAIAVVLPFVAEAAPIAYTSYQVLQLAYRIYNFYSSVIWDLTPSMVPQNRTEVVGHYEHYEDGNIPITRTVPVLDENGNQVYVAGWSNRDITHFACRVGHVLLVIDIATRSFRLFRECRKKCEDTQSLSKTLFPHYYKWRQLEISKIRKEYRVISQSLEKSADPIVRGQVERFFPQLSAPAYSSPESPKRCDMSKKIVSFPVKAPCNHLFEHSKIVKYLNCHHTCPAAGCRAFLQEENLRFAEDIYYVNRNRAAQLKNQFPNL